MTSSIFKRLRVAMLFVLCGALPGRAQDASSATERIYDAHIDRVRQVLQQLGGSAGGRLPGLDGFVAADLEYSDRYERPYYQYRVDMAVSGAGKTSVRVQAKISAWYVDPAPVHSQYRSLPSNGRLESDLLDRLEEALGKSAAVPRESKPSISNNNVPTKKDTASKLGNSTPGSAHEASRQAAPEGSDEAALLQQELEKLREQRRTLEGKSKDLQAQVTELDQSVHQQKTVSGLAAVKRSGASIMSRVSYSGPVLFRARAEDQFQPLARQAEWIQIRIAPASTGWILAEELALPKGMVVPEAKEVASSSSTEVTPASVSTSSGGAEPAEKQTPVAGPPALAQAGLGFWVSHEDVNTFSGDWGQLKGKKVLFVFVQPRGLLVEMAVDDRKLVYAKSVFSSHYKGANGAQNSYEGIVVIFMGGKGGVAAATISDIQAWVSGKMSEEAFVKRCSLDPRDEFHGWSAQRPVGQ
jgi:hypothetical protein